MCGWIQLPHLPPGHLHAVCSTWRVTGGMGNPRPQPRAPDRRDALANMASLATGPRLRVMEVEDWQQTEFEPVWCRSGPESEELCLICI